MLSPRNRKMKFSLWPLAVVTICMICLMIILFHGSEKYSYNGSEGSRFRAPRMKSFKAHYSDIHIDEKDEEKPNIATLENPSNESTVHFGKHQYESRVNGVRPSIGVIPLTGGDTEQTREIDSNELSLKEDATPLEGDREKNEVDADLPPPPILPEESEELVGSLTNNQQQQFSVQSHQRFISPSKSERNTLYHANLRVSSGGSTFPVLRQMHSVFVTQDLTKEYNSAEVIMAKHGTANINLKNIEENFHFNILTRMHRALKNGAPCTLPHTSSSGSSSVSSNSLSTRYHTFGQTDDISSLFESIGYLLHDTQPKSIFEFSASSSVTSTVSYAITHQYPTIMAIVFQSSIAAAVGSGSSDNDDTSGSAHLKDSSHGGRSERCGAPPSGPNLYTSSSWKSSTDTISSTRISRGIINAASMDGLKNPMDCLQIVDSLEMLVQNLLPFEFEAELGKVMCRCNFTYIPKLLPEDTFFSFWDSTAHLLHSALETVSRSEQNHQCRFTFDMSNRDVKFLSAVKYTHVIVQRNYTALTSSTPSSSSSSLSHYPRRKHSSYDRDDDSSKSEQMSRSNSNDGLLGGSFVSLALLANLQLDLSSQRRFWVSIFEHASIDGVLPAASSESVREQSTNEVRAATVGELVDYWIDSLVMKGAAAMNASEALQLERSVQHGDLSNSHDSASISKSDGSRSISSYSPSTSSSRSRYHTSYQNDREEEREEKGSNSVISVPKPTIADSSSSSSSSLGSNNIDTKDADNTTTITNTDNDHGPPRRRLYYSSSSSSRYGSSSSSSSSLRSDKSSTSSNYESDKPDHLPQYDQSVNWDFDEPESSAQQLLSGMQDFDEMDYVIKTQINLIDASPPSVGREQEKEKDMKHSSSSYRSSSHYSSSSSSSSGSSTSGKYSISSASRSLQRELHRREAATYQRWMRALYHSSSSSSTSSSVDSGVNTGSFHKELVHANMVYVFGRHISLLSLKLSKEMLVGAAAAAECGSAYSKISQQKGLLVSVVSDSLSVSSHTMLSTMLQLRNNIICQQPRWGLALVSSMLAAPERADVSIIHVDIVISLLTDVIAHVKEQHDREGVEQSRKDGEGTAEKTTAVNADACGTEIFTEALAALLSTAHISYIELPSPILLQRLLESTLPPTCLAVWAARFSLSSSAATSARIASMERDTILEASILQLKYDALVKITELPSAFTVARDSHQDEAAPAGGGSNLIIANRIYRIQVEYPTATTAAPSFVHRTSRYGLSVYSAIQLGIIPSQKKLLLKMLIDFPMWKLNNQHQQQPFSSSASSSSSSASGSRMTLQSWNLFMRLSDKLDPRHGGAGNRAAHSDWSLHFVAFPSSPSPSRSTGASDGGGGGAIDGYSRNHAAFTAHLRTQEATTTSSSSSSSSSSRISGAPLAVSLRRASPQSDRLQGRPVWRLLEYELAQHPAELAAEGRFSFVVHDSGFGYTSLRLALAYPNATVISLERSKHRVKHHVNMINAMEIENNAVCRKTETDETIYDNIYNSPELFRFQLLSRSMLDGFIDADSPEDWGRSLGSLLSSALTTFIYAPRSAQVSWAMHTIHGEIYDFQRSTTSPPSSSASAHFVRFTQRAPYRPISDALDGEWVDGEGGTTYSSNGRSNSGLPVGRGGGEIGQGAETLTGSGIGAVIRHKDLLRFSQLSQLCNHPQYPYKNFEAQWLLGKSTVERGSTALQVSALAAHGEMHRSSSSSSSSSPGGGGGGVAANVDQGGLFFKDAKQHRLATDNDLPLVRCDIVNMTRRVHHHYDYAKDGHKRTYTMHVIVNQTMTHTAVMDLGDPSAAHSFPTSRGIFLHHSEQSASGDTHHIARAHEQVVHHAMQKMQNGNRDHDNFNSTSSSALVPIPDAADGMKGSANSASQINQDMSGVLLPLGYHPSQHRIVGVHLFRDHDTFPIPYVSIYGVTLISALRLGLEHSQRDRLFKSFLGMSLYEDMAPWNVVLMGPKLDYIDYDTRDITFNKLIPRAYQVMTVLMNYKRTVEDFKRCGSKAPTTYGLPYVSECVGTDVDRDLHCSDLKFPVPCADGNCHTDYISCLRAITAQAENLIMIDTAQEEKETAKLASDVQKHYHSLATAGTSNNKAVIENSIVAAMKSVVGSFDGEKSSLA